MNCGAKRDLPLRVNGAFDRLDTAWYHYSSNGLLDSIVDFRFASTTTRFKYDSLGLVKSIERDYIDYRRPPYNHRNTITWNFLDKKVKNQGGTLSDQNDPFINNNEISVYPNPCTDHLYVEARDNSTRFKIISLGGNVCLEGVLAKGGIDVNHLPSGAYVMQLWSPSGIQTQKFWKQ